MPQHNTHFPSIRSWIQDLEQSQDPAGSWIQYTNKEHGDASLHENCSGVDCPQTLDNFCQQTKTLYGLEQTISQIQDLAYGLQLDLPQLPSVRRVKSWGTTGSTVSIQRALQGHTKPWRRTSSAPVARTARTATVLIPCTFPYTMSATDIVWTVTASCAYASMLHAAGVSIELVVVAAGLAVWGDIDNLMTIELKALGAAWDIHGLALLCQAAFFRRGVFRYFECQVPNQGQVNPTYGLAPTRKQLPAILAKHTSWHPAQATLWGAHHSDHITDHATAKAWIQAQDPVALAS